jgi:glycerol uptake facilitator protein/aquaporin Z
MWVSGAFPGAAVIPYIVAQLAGSLLGVLTARAVWGSVIDGPPVNSACLQPAPGWTNWALFPAEAASMAAIVLLVAWFWPYRDWRPWYQAWSGSSGRVPLGCHEAGCPQP